jgi:two-component system, NarL family, invasion response regulator UvrY
MIKLFIADDHPVVREGLKRIILDCHDMQLVGEAEDGNVLLEKCGQIEIDVLLLDISMPGPGFLEVLQRISMKYPDIRILVLSIHPEDHYAIRAMKSGAVGYLTKNHTPEELAKAVRHVYKGHRYVTIQLAEKLITTLNVSNEDYEMLSDREYQILCMFGTGKDTNVIASTLNLSPKTISTYRSRILEKLKLDTKGELIRYAIEHGLTD